MAIVFSRTLQHVNWKNTTLKKEISKEEILKLKQSRLGGSSPILVGSPGLIVALTQLDLIDEYSDCRPPHCFRKRLTLI